MLVSLGNEMVSSKELFSFFLFRLFHRPHSFLVSRLSIGPLALPPRLKFLLPCYNGCTSVVGQHWPFSASYILLFPVNLFMDFFESELLAAAWWAYMRPMLALCHVTISTSALLIVAAAFERYLTISRIKIGFHRNHRIIISLIALLFALLCKAPLFFELEVYFIIIRRMSRSTAVRDLQNVVFFDCHNFNPSSTAIKAIDIVTEVGSRYCNWRDDEKL